MLILPCFLIQVNLYLTVEVSVTPVSSLLSVFPCVPPETGSSQRAKKEVAISLKRSSVI